VTVFLESVWEPKENWFYNLWRRRKTMWTKKDAMEAAARGEGCLGKAADDEPVFILRGKDAMMAITIEAWAAYVDGVGGRGTKSIEARKFAEEIREWQSVNGCKVPD
jgi:hypothetical protein